MLILSRRKQESIRISDDIVVTVLEIQRNRVRLGIDAPEEVPVLRTELQNRNLASPARDYHIKATCNAVAELTKVVPS